MLTVPRTPLSRASRTPCRWIFGLSALLITVLAASPSLLSAQAVPTVVGPFGPGPMPYGQSGTGQSGYGQTAPASPPARQPAIQIGSRNATNPVGEGNGTAPPQAASPTDLNANPTKVADPRTDRREVPQDPPTEFQRLVSESTGTILPIFGANLFGDVPSTFAPVEDIPVAPDYILGPGDQLRIQVYGQINQQGTFTVNRTGDIAYPEVGTIHVAGIKYAQLEEFLKSQLSRVYRNFSLNVNLGQLRSIQVFVFGNAHRPGAYTISSLSTLLNALFASGGPSPQGSLRDIQLRRADQTITHFDLYDLLLHGDKTHDIALVSGDVIFIPPVAAQAAVIGSVNTPAIYETRPGTTVNDIIELAGGKTSVALGAQVRLDRIFEHSMRSIIDVNGARGDNPVVAGGDIVTVATISNQYKDAVTLRGNVAFPGRYVWHPGMRILDLVPTRDQLITRDYYRRRNTLGNPAAPFALPDPVGSLQVRSSATTQQADSATQSGTATSSRGGSSVGAALTDDNGVFPATNEVVLSAPDVDFNYAVIERLDPATLTTALLPFKPGLLYMGNDQSQNLALQPGDVLTFFSTADIKVPTSQQTRFVRLEGEFVASGVYSVQPDETLRQLLTRVGGFTPEAYLYGSEFTRQSTRRVQQQRLNEYADNLEAQVSAYAASSGARAVSVQDSATSSAAVVQARESVARLRRVTPLGRIVLEVKPDSRTIDSIPDLPLEDGDRFVVPRVPSTVNVEGQVYNANSFVFVRQRRERDYLRQAGGPDRDADRGRIFILRADGSVFSGQYGNVNHANMFPGDTIVVPLQLAQRSLLRNLVDISTVIGQFGLGIAAINVLK